jgi:hypothetical protein
MAGVIGGIHSSDKWITKASNEAYLNLHDDYVTILGSGINVGGRAFGVTSPLTPATVDWKIGDGEMTAI